MSLFHTHKYGEIDSNGYQYCTICNKAIFIATPKCNHVWEDIEKIGHSNRFNPNGYFKFTYIQRCRKCGELSQFST